jgi:cysteine synthase A
MKVVKNALGLIGHTPLIKINKLAKRGYADIYASAEFLNPSGSIKDEMVWHIIEQAEKRGKLKKGKAIVEATTGNTGVAVAMVAAVKGYKAVIVMPKTRIKKNKMQMLKLLGAKVILVPEEKGIEGVVKKGRQIAKRRKAFFVNQFENPDNVHAHEIITGRDVLKGLRNRVDSFVASIGTGGTLLGVATALKRQRIDARIVAVEPEKSPVFYCRFYDKAAPKVRGIGHKIEGIGEGFVPKLLEENMRIIDEVVLVSDKDAIRTAKRLARKEGLLVGPSSGANVFVALKEAKRLGNGKIVATVLPDSGQRYLGTNVFG